jgi:uncharacterized protein
MRRIALLLLLLLASPAVAQEPPPPPSLAAGVAAYAAGDARRAGVALRTASAQGSPVADTLLGVMAARGAGAPADLATAAGWFTRAARRRYAPAQLALADAYARGRGVPRDPVMAERLARAAAAQGQPGAAALLASLKR